MSRPDPPSDFRPAASWANLRLRARLLAGVRAFFDQRGFLEVETPLLSADTVVDRHLDPLCVDVPGWGRRWLQTSPEFAMKRLLGAGARAIYQITRAFRRDEFGPLHNPEFTMVEWYRAGDGPEQGMQLLSDLAEAVLGRGPAERLSYAEAFRRHAGVDPHAASSDELVAAARAAGIIAPASLAHDDRDGWLDLLLTHCVQPRLGRGGSPFSPQVKEGTVPLAPPCILYDYPASQAALARVRQGNPPVAERFELYADGIELANGYHELLDPDVLRERNRRNNALRRADGKGPLPEESRLLAAMEAGLPGAVGVALGFDRLVMVAAGAKTLAEVTAFPFDRA